MKYILLGSLLFFFACYQKETTAESVVEDYVKKHSNDPAAYEPIETKVDSLFLGFEKTKDGMTIMDSLNKYNELTSDQVDLLLDPDISAKRDSFFKAYQERKGRFAPVFYGWKVIHNYRGKNALGALISTVDTFYLDKNLNIVTYEAISIDN